MSTLSSKDKAYLIPTWISLMSTITSACWSKFGAFQFAVLWTLVLVEVASAAIRFQAYFTAPGSDPPILKNLEFSGSSAITANSVGKAKQTFQMLGTSLFVIPIFRVIGLVLLTATIPLAYESVRRKLTKRVIFVDGTYVDKLDHKVLKFWMQACQLGSKLCVGISTGEASRNEMIFNACSVSVIDSVIVEAPANIDLRFLNKFHLDYIVIPAAKHNNYLFMASGYCVVKRFKMAKTEKLSVSAR